MKPINSIYVVGGGSAGAMTACTLKKVFPEKDIRIIQSPKIATVGVGESTLETINGWLALMGIEDKDFMKECDASYKLSIRFEDFYQKNDGGFHYPFGLPYLAQNLVRANDWYFKKFGYPDTPISDYTNCLYPNMALINENKITGAPILPNWTLKKNVAYHFDATKFGNWLKEKYFRRLGGRIVSEEIIDITRHEDGSIKSLILNTGDGHHNNEISADLYIDCTGFKSLLLGYTLKEPFESYGEMLPNNSAWATKKPYKNKEKELVGYTNCKAVENGWIWNIPLWSRMGTGYVYSDKYISDEDALEQFKSHIGGEDLEFKNIKMRIGIHKRLWVKNVCAIGLSAGFIEPLESNGLLSVHEFLVHLINVLKKNTISEFAKQHFNVACRRMYNGFAEFVALHYALSDRTDTEYWRDIQKKEYPIEERFFNESSDFQGAFRHKMLKFEYPRDGGLHCIATGMNWFPTSFETIQYYLANNDMDYYEKEWQPTIDRLNERKKHWKELVKDCPTLYEYLKKNIYNDTH